MNLENTQSCKSTKETAQLSSLTIITVLFAEGIISLSSEIIAIRQITIFGGNVVTVTSIIIGIFLSALALGYTYAKNTKNIKDTLSKNFLIAGIVLGIGLSLEAQIILANTFHNRWAYVVIASILMVAPIAFLLSQTLPILTMTMKSLTSLQASSRVLYISTLGSFIGAIVTPVLLIQVIGVSLTIAFISSIALLLALYLGFQTKTNIITIATSMVFVIIINFNASPFNHQQNIIVNDNIYATTFINDKKQYRYLLLNSNNSSRINSDHQGGEFQYIKTIQHEIEAYSKATNNNKLRILIIGAGGFTISTPLSSHQYTYIDPNPDLKEIAEKHFLKRKIKGQVAIDDGLHWLIQNYDEYDLIILDAYKSQLSFPVQLMTSDFFQIVQKHLKNNGLLLINIIRAYPATQFDVNVNATIRSVFPMCSSYYIYPSRTPQNNVLYSCYNNKIKPSRIASFDLPLVK